MFEFVRDVELHASRKLIKPETDSQDLLVIEKVTVVRETLNLYDFFNTASEDEGDCAVSILEQRWQKLLSTDDDGWLALASLLNWKYWSRIWIVQEYVLAQHRIIHYGRHIIDIEKLDVAIAHILRLDLGRHPDINSRIQDSVSRIQTSPGALIVKYAIPWLSLRRSILELLVACKNSEAAEPRDKIYAILGLARDIWSLDFKVDYAKPIFEIKFDVLQSYLSLNWSADCRKKAAKLWFMLNEMLPETLDTPTRNERENVSQSIINEVRTIPPHAWQIQTIIEQLDFTFDPSKALPQSQCQLEVTGNLGTKSANQFFRQNMAQ